jgi:hypothetical protein
MTNEIQDYRNPFLQFVLGFLFGVVVFVLVAAASTYYLQGHHYCSSTQFSSGVTHCIPVFEYAILRAASWGPVALVYMTQPSLHLTEMRMQIISAAIFGIVSALLFIYQSRRSPMEIFLITYVILIAFTAMLILMIVLAG